MIVPVFDRIDYLVEALQSIERQTSPPEEIVVVMDGSTVDVSAALAATGARARVVRRPRGGPGAARNTGCAAATGTLFAFLDSDDLWRPEKLERQLDALREDPGLDFVFTGIEQFFSPELHRGGVPTRFAAAERSGRMLSAMVVRAVAFWRVGGFREDVVFGELLDWCGRAADLGLRWATLDTVLVRRRVHEQNAGVRFRSARHDYVDVVKTMLDRRRTSARAADGSAGATVVDRAEGAG